MCLIRGPVQSVKKTTIFVAPSTDGTRQLTVYSNEVATEQANMMILPVPYPETVAFEAETMNYVNLFSDLEASFIVETLSTQNPLAMRSLSSIEEEPLEVRQVGPYRVSVALTLADLGRLDTEKLGPLPTELRDMLARTYGPEEMPVPYGFICCALDPGAARYAPLAYTHRALEAGLFVPTKHFHGSSKDQDSSVATDWDHLVYSVRTDISVAHTPGAYPTPENKLEWGQLPPNFRYWRMESLRRWKAVGVYTNKDLLFPLRRTPAPAAPRPPRARTPPSPISQGLTTLLSGLRGFFTR